MVLGLRSKSKKGASTRAVYAICIQEIKPWPPSHSLKSLRSVVLQWENGHRNSGTTKIVSPSLGPSSAEGKIEFNESFKLDIALLKEGGTAKKNDKNSFQKNMLEFNLYEPRRDKSKGQNLGTAIIDLAEYGVIEETVTMSVPLNSKRNIRNAAQPLLYVKIQPSEKESASSSSKAGSSDKEAIESVSALMNEEYAEEAEFESFTDDDVSSYSSMANSSSTLEANTDLLISTLSLSESLISTEEKPGTISTPFLSSSTLGDEMMSIDTENFSSQDVQDKMMDCKNIQSIAEVILQNENVYTIKDIDQTSEIELQSQYRTNGLKEVASVHEVDDMVNQVTVSPVEYEGIENQLANVESNLDRSESLSITRASSENIPVHRGTVSFDSTISSHEPIVESISKSFTSERIKGLRFSVRSPRHVKGLTINGSNPLSEDVREIGILEDKRDSPTISGADEVVDEKKSMSPHSGKTRHASRVRRNDFFHDKIQELELRVNSLEGELREAATIEIGLYSIVAEHGSSKHKLHTPARRLSRLYRHALNQLSVERRSGAAKSIVSGLALASKACGNDVPRLTFWLSNTIILRAIISKTVSHLDSAKNAEPYAAVHGSMRNGNGMSSPLKWQSSSGKNDSFSFSEELENWEDPETLIHALGKIETWIFQRIVESLWWQTFTPYMQHTHEIGAGRTKRVSNQEQSISSIGTWKRAFKGAFEKICPVRAGGHACGCLSTIARLIMEQCMSRLDVAMFNAILRESDDEIPTDPLSDPISDPEVLPINCGEFSFGAGARLKNSIGNWSRLLTDLFSMDADDSPHYKDDQDDALSFRSFPLLNELSGLFMLPKDMILEESVRLEVCPIFSSSVIRQILERFVPDEFSPDQVPSTVLKALEMEESLESNTMEEIRNIPCSASPTVYSQPSVASVKGILGEVQVTSHLKRSGSFFTRKSHNSDDELDELDSPLDAFILNKTSILTPRMKDSNFPSAVRYHLLRELWEDDEQLM